VIESSNLIAGRVLVLYLIDAKSEVGVYSLNGRHEGKLPLPGIGTVTSLSGKFDMPNIFYAFSSFIYPTTVFHYDFRTQRQTAFHAPLVNFNPNEYATKQVFYRSKDGTLIPMFITMKKGLKLDRNNPTILYGYGGFDISVTPSFNPIILCSWKWVAYMR
jgi:prolyl oligopeptidase